MKRLKNILLGLEPNTQTYSEMYEGEMRIVPPNSPSYIDNDSKYYRENIGFEFSRSHKLAQDKPTVTIIIPADLLFIEKEDLPMKRLKYYLLQMENSTATYKEIYEGKTEVHFPLKSNGDELDPEIQYDANYWHDQISFNIDATHKLAQDKPTLTYHIPTEKLGATAYTTAAADYCLRALRPYIDELNAELYNRSRPDKENGKYYLYNPGGEVLTRNLAYFALCSQKDYVNGSGNTVYLLDDGVPRPPKMCLCIRIQVQLPYKKIRKAMQMLCRDLPDAVDMFVTQFDCEYLNDILTLAEKQAAIRAWLRTSEYSAFIANGSVLPRDKGTELPMKNAIPFKSTTGDEIEVCGVRGMGIRRGVMVITGGGYSGKSTLLDAISAGIYNHISGDGRELCITDDSAVTISAEDGRSVKNVNISPFIKWIPGGDTRNFSTEHASGSTSQAANIMEAVNAGAKLLLIDEDKSATNFMIRDRMMKELIEREPITPFTDRVNELYRENGVSTILVIGGSGEYLSVSDKIYMMEDFLIHDVTEQSKMICNKYGVAAGLPTSVNWSYLRTLLSDGFSSYPEGCGTERLEVSDMGFILIGDERIDIRMLHNIVTPAQLNAVGFILRQLELTNRDYKINIDERMDQMYEQIEKEGLDCVFSSFFTTCERFLDLPRKCELLAVINRMRGVKFVIEGK
ncbi:MAG: ABC-ATPase domain-containing protein [Oscillospiraceae bacterium]|nr:ABC-ATPase domain-containing protein [Oscillospiraceae bacterium]